MNNNKNDEKKREVKIWNDTEVKLLKKWGEQAASYRVLHNNAYRKYRHRNILFTLPVIIMSTMTGTANFSQGTISEIYPDCIIYLPLIIGALNLISGIITTISQFLRISELTEAHRNSSISYGKFARNISTELSLPPQERTYNGIDYILICRNEMDRLIEQSPEIGMKTIKKFEKNKKFKDIIRPEIINISQIDVYEPTKKEVISQLVGEEMERYKDRINYKRKKHNELLNNSKNPNIRTEIELSNLQDKNLVKNYSNNINNNLNNLSKASSSLRTSSSEELVVGNPELNEKAKKNLKNNLKYLHDNNYLGSSMYNLNTKDFDADSKVKNKLQRRMSKSFNKGKNIFEVSEPKNTKFVKTMKVTRKSRAVVDDSSSNSSDYNYDKNKKRLSFNDENIKIKNSSNFKKIKKNKNHVNVDINKLSETLDNNEDVITIINDIPSAINEANTSEENNVSEDTESEDTESDNANEEEPNENSDSNNDSNNDSDSNNPNEDNTNEDNVNEDNNPN